MSPNTNVQLQIDVALLKQTVADLIEEVDTLKESNRKVTEMANRWKGAGAVVIALGSVAGVLFAYYDKIKAFLFKLGG